MIMTTIMGMITITSMTTITGMPTTHEYCKEEGTGLFRFRQRPHM